ncbi:MAG TPA: 4-amino-4-deoxychorismate lyase [Verrucomicrobiales bacterium]|nr:4-amino-4-deoxychorismate lyase [Verrucomicrobiales bacterium]
MNKTPHIWLNGVILPAAEARISPFEHGLLVGDGVFETLVMLRGRVIGGHEHWQRLERSCARMGLPCMTEAEFLSAIEEVARANGLADARVRVTLTSGDGPLGSDRGAGRGTRLAAATPLNTWPPVEKVRLVPWTRNENGALAGVKSISYAENVLALAEAKKHGCGEALLASTRGELCEGTGSNIFVVAGGALMTPPLSSGCLAGITRLLVLRACGRAGIPCAEQAMPAAVLDTCDEAFLTSSTRHVHPIAEVNGRALAAPGPVTLAVRAAYSELIGL